MSKIHYAVGGIFTVLVVHVIATISGFYYQFGWFDIPMHFFGGYVMAILGLALYQKLIVNLESSTDVNSRTKVSKLLLSFIFVLGLVMIIGVAWEWYEFLFDQFAKLMVTKYGVAQMGLPDTMDDLFNDFLGAIAAWLLWRKST